MFAPTRLSLIAFSAFFISAGFLTSNLASAGSLGPAAPTNQTGTVPSAREDGFQEGAVQEKVDSKESKKKAVEDLDEKTGAEEESDPLEKAKEYAKKLRVLEHGLAIAEMDLELAELTTKMERSQAEVNVSNAKLELGDAQAALKSFIEHEAPVALESARINLDQSKYRSDHAKDELAELIAMYEAEEFAEMTKELVVKRSRRNLEIAERELDVSRRNLEHLQKQEHPQKQRKLERALQSQQRAVETAEMNLAKTEFEIKMNMMKGRFALETAKQELESHQEQGPKS